MPNFDFNRNKSTLTNVSIANVAIGTVTEVDTTTEESTFLPFIHGSITPTSFIVSGCTLGVSTTITTNLPNGFSNIRAGDAVVLSTAGGATMANTTVSFVVNSTTIIVATAPTVAGTANSSTLTFTPQVSGCTLTNGSTTITTTVVNGFDRVQPGDSVSVVTANGAAMANTTVVTVLSSNTITVATAPTASTTSGQATTLSFSPIISGCTLTSGSTTITTNVANGFTRVRPGDSVTLSTAGGATMANTTVSSVVNSTTITVATAPTGTGTTNGSSLTFTPVAITPPVWAIKLVYQKVGSLLTIRPTFYLYDGSIGNGSPTIINAISATNLVDANGNSPTIDLDAYYNSIRVARSL